MVVEILGWVATAAVLSSFTVKEMEKLRLLNGIGSVLWILYGVLQTDFPIIFVNVAVLCIHLIWFIKNKT